ncbi:response regulator [Catenuloplanes indicus]|uniref:DNA-binding NarL/FixJ family response regulator n=1 Tax=Catenuloplanes indicus TaxID=137267 RepID=A0AAE3VWC8_9ACTN|nr:response regulator transcription factor [Catenuloplanes indicus]MDQ0364812.1 DNA-binding NarL/FixJ family response regulator [Catenuloplanes indicus]
MRVVLIDDHPMFLQGMELLLPKITDGRATVVAATQDAAAAAGLVLRTVADLALVDLHMPPPGGVRAIAAIRRTVPRTRIVAMSGDEHPEPVIEALRAGAEGFLPKTTDAEALLTPLLSVLDGWSVLPSWLLGSLITPAPANRPVPVRLDEAERRLLRSIAAGATTTEIAEELHVSERTVKRLTAALLRRLRVTSRTEAAALAGSTGLI